MAAVAPQSDAKVEVKSVEQPAQAAAQPPQAAASATGTSITKQCGIQTKPPKNCCKILLLIPVHFIALPFVLVWFILSLVFGLLMLPFGCCTKRVWLATFFRDLCGSEMKQDEMDEVESYLLSELKDQFSGSPAPPANPMRPHPRTQALLTGTFTIPELPEQLRVGLFSKPASYDAVARLSEAFDQNKDTGVHGLAVKLCAVPSDLGGGNELYKDEGAAISKEAAQGTPADYGNGTQEMDFLTFSPAFFDVISSTREFAWIVTVNSRRCCAVPRTVFYLPFFRAIRGLVGLKKQAACEHEGRGPIGYAFGSSAAYKFGNRVCKYFWLPDQEHKIASPGCCASGEPVPKVVGEFMGRNAASFGLYVQLRPEEKDPRFAEFALDPHPHRPWDQDYAPLFRVGTLSLPSQNIDTDARWQLGQAISFNPWNTMSLHAPLGSIAHARRRVYPHVCVMREARLGMMGTPRCPFLTIAGAQQA